MANAVLSTSPTLWSWTTGMGSVRIDLQSQGGGPVFTGSMLECTAEVAPVNTVALHFLLANFQQKKLALTELLLESEKCGIQVALVQEPYVGREDRVSNWSGIRVFQCADNGESTVKSAIIVFNALRYTVYPKVTSNNISVEGIRTSAWEIALVSFYFKPDLPMHLFLAHLRKFGSSWELGDG
ncbi:unnamed protein product [Euphydryas editha]|uniref:Uncharacterized protein n=1 Tax=Euphydryas editha TaxID=104508 RepID=A0AAU9TJP8_EUPED|nr:unnamed protein product [Euphydryas editha]